MRQHKSNVKLRWSYYLLPGFIPAPDGNGYIPEEDYDRLSNATENKGG